jgi:hypothetical protein
MVAVSFMLRDNKLEINPKGCYIPTWWSYELAENQIRTWLDKNPWCITYMEELNGS